MKRSSPQRKIKTLTDEEKTEKIEELQAKRKALSEQRHAFLRDAEGVFNEQHQKGNDEAQADIGQKLVKGIWTSADDVYRNRDDISSRLRSKSKRECRSHLPLQVTDFELSTLRVEILFGERQELSPEAILELAQSLQRSGQFDEDFYLASYADVASAVAGGHFKDGKEHFKTFGDNEGRSGWFSGERYDFDEVYYLSENPDIAVAIVQGQYRSGAHHFWSTGRAQGLKKNEGNNELLRAINLDGPEIKPEELTTQTRQTTDGDFTLGFRSKGSRVENHLEGLFSGDIYPDAYLDIHDAANKMDPESRRAVKGATKPLVNLAKALEKTAGEATKDSEVIPTFIKTVKPLLMVLLTSRIKLQTIASLQSRLKRMMNNLKSNSYESSEKTGKSKRLTRPILSANQIYSKPFKMPTKHWDKTNPTQHCSKVCVIF